MTVVFPFGTWAGNSTKCGAGNWVIQFDDGGLDSFAIGVRDNEMALFQCPYGGRMYVKGPFYFKSLSGGPTVTRLPDGLIVSEGGTNWSQGSPVSPGAFVSRGK